MSGYLLDINVLVALSWPRHVHHAKVGRWFARHAEVGWATCPFTESAFVRLLSNPGFSRDCLTVRDALSLLESNTQHPAHRFWADELSLSDAVQRSRDRLVGHQQVRDAYLLGLALHKNAKLATLDGGIVALLGEESPDRAHLEVIK